MKSISDIKVLVLEGTPRERGQTHGKALKSLINEGIEIWKSHLQNVTGIDPDNYFEQFMKETKLVAAAEKWAPHLLEEVKGIGEGAGVDFNTIFVWQCADEEWWYRPYPPVKQESNSCSSLGCSKVGNNPAVIAQNMDLPNHNDGYQVLLHIKQGESLESFIFTIAGVIGLNGMNNTPLGICCNTLLDLNHAADGLPVAFIVRSVLERPSVDKAVEFIQKIKHASGQNYIIGDGERAVDFECSANKVCQYAPCGEVNRVYHTNHAIINADKASWVTGFFNTLANFNYLESQPNDPAHRSILEGTKNIFNTLSRFNFLESQLRDPLKNISPEVIRAILGTHESPICVHNTHQPGFSTLGSMIMVLSSPPELHLASGPPCSKEYRVFRF
ncbi:MAG TPA: C45 family peptidase [Candidatus Acidoferrum sp.]|nr:C45 family peptidase [Candidatus Acidoferrum sp.]